MSLYYILHKHDAQTCPAKDPIYGSNLLSQLIPINARQFGVSIQNDAVLDNQRTFVLMVEAESKAKIENI